MKARFKQQLPLHLMLLPAVIILIIFHYVPIFGVVIAFQDYSPGKGILGSEWVGLENFQYVFSLPSFWGVIFNTFFIAVTKLILNIVFPLTFALLLNEIGNSFRQLLICPTSYHGLFWVVCW